MRITARELAVAFMPPVLSLRSALFTILLDTRTLTLKYAICNLEEPDARNRM